MNGQEAFNMIIKEVKQNNYANNSYHCILMDCNMPIMDGYESTIKIREYLYHINVDQPIILAVTGHTEE